MSAQTPVQRTRRPLSNMIAALLFLAMAMSAAARQMPVKPGDIRNMVNQSAQAGSSDGDASKPAAKPKPGSVSETSKPAASPMPKPVPKPASGTDVKPVSAPTPKPAAKPAPGSETKPVTNAVSKPVVKPGVKPGDDAKSSANAIPKPAAKSGPVSEISKPTPKTVAKPGAPANRVPELTTVANPIPEPPKAPSPLQPPAKSAVPAKPAAPAATPAAFSVAVSRRDPFAPLVNSARGEGVPENLPPGKAGLLINTLRIDGIVNGPGGMIAIVSNPQQRVYFLRDNDRLYDGEVQHITMEGVSFHQSGKDPFGNPVEREVTKRLSLTPGEQR